MQRHATDSATIATPVMPALTDINRQLGISDTIIDSLPGRGFTLQPYPGTLVSIDCSIHGRQVLVEPDTANAWRKMKHAAMSCGIQLNAESGFRSVEEQVAIISGRLRNATIDQVLIGVAVPGYSEHHSGCAIDISNNAALIHPIGAAFDATDTFKWLAENGSKFGFKMSYPRDNPYGIMYEPWHWCYQHKTPS